ncbi:DUF551 domain-containing protein [Enterobacteriaceae bacterium 4M9]|nr:DUF551 domain-containing protein [Enterobacteriaceae bacterium 4M9]
MINRDKLEHMLRYAKQRKALNVPSTVPPDDMIEIVQRLLAGNSPVIPDGCVMVPENATTEMVKAGAAAAKEYMEETGRNSPGVIYSAMLAASTRYPGAEQRISDATEQMKAGAPGVFAAPELADPAAVMAGTCAQRWIPCSERMPRHGKTVIFASNGNALAGHYDDGRHLRKPVGKWIWLGRVYSNEVTHWMPLPAAPAQEDN